MFLQGRDDRAVGDFGEVPVEKADGPERFRMIEADDLVRFAAHLTTALRRTDRNGDDEPGRALAFNRARSRGHARTGCHAIVDQDYAAPGVRGPRPAATISPLALRRQASLTG